MRHPQGVSGDCYTLGKSSEATEEEEEEEEEEDDGVVHKFKESSYMTRRAMERKIQHCLPFSKLLKFFLSFLSYNFETAKNI